MNRRSLHAADGEPLRYRGWSPASAVQRVTARSRLANMAVSADTIGEPLSPSQVECFPNHVEVRQGIRVRLSFIG